MHRARKPHTGGDGKPLAARRGERLAFERRPTEYAGWIWCRRLEDDGTPRRGSVGDDASGPIADGPIADGPTADAGWVPEAWVRIEGQTCVLLRDYDSTELRVEAGEDVTVQLVESGWAWVGGSCGRMGWVPLECLEKIPVEDAATGAARVAEERGGLGPPQHSDRGYYGRVYHILFDRALDASRSAIVALVREGSSVLEIASGTGDLAFALAREKRCRVVGIDLSPRMLAFAASHNPYEEVSFARADATDLAGFSVGRFDYATVSLLLHELPRDARPVVLGEALRVAGQVIVADWITPLPRSFEGLSIRFIEWAGRHHYGDFRDYLARGGLDGVLADLRTRAVVEHREVLPRTCREIVVLSRGAGV